MKHDIYQEVTNEIIAIMESGQFRPIDWTRDGLPSNYTSKKRYSGINTIILGVQALRNPGYGSKWLTYKQAETAGGQVRKGEKGTRVVFFKPWVVADKNDPNGKEKTVPVLRQFVVFNSAQIEGLPESEKKLDPMPASVIEAMCASHAQGLLNQANVIVGGDSAYYRPSTDQIVMPDKSRFSTIQNWYAVALHEMVHWSGHKSRLDRDAALAKYDEAERYAREELVAELGAAFICGSIGFEGTNEGHADYLASWLKILKHDSRAIFRAAAMAQKAADFVFKEQSEAVFEETEAA